MFGYWAMGRPRMATIPTMTMMIEMTMATIGLLMKNLAMAGYLFPGLGLGLASGLASGFWAAPVSLVSRAKRLRAHRHSVPNLLGPFRNHLLPGLQTFLDDPELPVPTPRP